MTKTWHDFYKERMNQRYREHVKKRYEPFLEEVRRAAWDKERIMEAGCGAGFISALVAMSLGGFKKCPTLHLVDKEIELIDLIDENFSVMDVDYHTLSIKNILAQEDRGILAPRFQPGSYDVIYSHGVLEHFSNQDIWLAIRNQMDWLAPGGRLVHYVPSDRYETPSFGDERLMSPKQWMEIAQPNRIKRFNDGYDVTLIWSKP